MFAGEAPAYSDITKLDERLRRWNLIRQPVPADGNCFFHAVERQLEVRYPLKKLNFNRLRRNCVNYLRANESIGPKSGEAWRNFLQNETAEEYLSRMTENGEWADNLMVQSMASLLKCTITIITTTGDAENSVVTIYPKDSGSDDYITIGHVAEYHFFSAENEGGEEKRPIGRDINSVEEGDILQFWRTSKAEIRIEPPPKSALHKKGDDKKRKLTGVSLHAKFEDSGVGGFGKHKNSMELLGGKADGEADNSKSVYEEIAQRRKGGGELELMMMEGRGGHQRNIDAELEVDERSPLVKKETPKWDEFIVEPPEDTNFDDGVLLNFFTKLAKYLTVVIFGGAVFMGSVASRGSLLVLANAYTQTYDATTGCPKYIENNNTTHYYYIRYMVMLTMMVCLCFPEVLSFAYCLYRIIMKSEKAMNWGVCFKGMIPEILHAIGLTFLVVKVTPNIDATLAVLMFSLVGAVPSAIHLHAKYQAIARNKNKHQDAKVRLNRLRDFAFSIISLILQPLGIVLLCWQIKTSSDVDWSFYVYVILSLLLISCRYWENFVTCDFIFTKTMRIQAHETQKELDRIRFKTGIIYSIVRMVFIVGTCFLIYFVIDGNKATVNMRSGKDVMFRDYSSPSSNCRRLVNSFWYTTLTHCLCGLGAFWFGRTACQTLIQVQAYSFPLILVSPIMALLTSLYAMHAPSGISLTQYFGLSIDQHLWKFVGWKLTLDLESWQMGVTIVVGLLVGWGTLILLTFMIWKPMAARLARTEVVFVKPIYSGVLITEDLMLNRRQYHSLFTERKNREELSQRQERERRATTRASKRMSRRLTVNMNRKFTPQVFLCATMWHETEQEMTQLLTSIMRLDKDQGMRRPKARDDPDFYNFQVHVMFDDAMDLTEDGSKPNKWVHQLIKVLPIAADKVQLGTGLDIKPPFIYPTPYGGRLEFVLPNGNLFLVHLKDKSKIRHRKRWSQCMYMYYILGYLQQTKKSYKPQDVFILALDGDVDFQPKAMLLLLDRMKRNPDVGAACGRIHPVGSGPVVWFQKFEYAVGHWLQKTAEHVLGCVLCSPGCFSLFRGEALMDTNVVKMYTTKPTEALHYIQWDQGEDRWLCTLLLKQGWRIEFSAASDSYTFAPEEFKEFYNQRRRWGPSTMANVFDILLNGGLTVRNNQYISWGYIAYQMGLMISSILGPATVVLVIQGSFQYVFRMSPLGSLLIALIPVVIFIILCYTTKPDFQIAVAGILTIIYALIMMAVLVGIIGQMVETLLNPNSIFMLTMIFMYAFTGIIHPTEMLCLMHGVLYYLCVPSAFILLMVYSLCNMNNVTWGTREVRKPEAEAAKQALEEVAQKKQGGDKNKNKIQIGPSTVHDAQETQGYYSCGLGNLCQCALCIPPEIPSASQPQAYQKLPTQDPYYRRKSMMYKEVVGSEKKDMIRKYSIAKSKFMGEQESNPKYLRKSLNQRLSVYDLRRMKEADGVENVATLRKSILRKRMSVRKEEESHEKAMRHARKVDEEARRKITSPTGIEDDDDDDDDDDDEGDLDSFDDGSEADSERLEDEEGESLYWILDGPMEDGIIDYLDDEEHEFWREMIKKYLLPLNEDKKEKARIKADLEALKNKMTGAYFLINALWIVLTFSLTLAIQDINITFYDRNGNEVVLQPLAFLFLIFFLIILVIQFVTMLIHRWSTFIHLMSTTGFHWTDNRSINRSVKPDSEKKKEKKKKDAAPNDVENAAAHDNPAYESNNFSYKGTNGLSYSAGEMEEIDDPTTTRQPSVIQIKRNGSLRWQDESTTPMATTLAQVEEPKKAAPEYAEISLGESSGDYLDQEDNFQSYRPKILQPQSQFSDTNEDLFVDVMNRSRNSSKQESLSDEDEIAQTVL